MLTGALLLFSEILVVAMQMMDVSACCLDNPLTSWPRNWGTAHTEIKVTLPERPVLSEVLLLKPEVGQNIVMHASPTDRIFFF